ncbi:hypothetical protein [Brassicibacter mesophilus]|uniref:hypothetical protein n=1 Tax=Brassicibacter mesophilus TaxID=745119 RepID=UPI003D22DDAB
MENDNNKKIEKAIEDLKGKIEPTEEQLDKIKNIAEKYSNKSDEEIFFEIIKLNKQMAGSMGEDEYKDKIAKLEKIRPLLNEEQSKKLDMILMLMRNGQ